MAKGRKVYLNGGAKEVVFEDGNSLINCYIDLDQAKADGFLTKTKAGKNILVFTIERRREESNYGDTHSFFRKEMGEAEQKPKAAAAKSYSAKPASKKVEVEEDDDLPF